MDKLEIPRKDLERMLQENLDDQKYWETNRNTEMANWHEGRASLIRLLLNVWG